MNKSVTEHSTRDGWMDWVQAYRVLLRVLGEDIERPGLKHTPERAAHALQYLTRGYAESIDTVVNDALFPSSSEEMVVVKNIELYSLCEHHLLPFFGTCHIAYLPHGQILGLSKFARIVDVYARRLQVQEELTQANIQYETRSLTTH